MEPVKTCGGCWYGPSEGQTAECKAPVPICAYVIRNVSSGINATNCKCWRKRWVEGR